MLKLSLRDLRSHIARYIFTFVAVAIGVAFMGGVLTLTDTINRAFDDLFSDVNEGTDAVVRGEGQFEVDAGMGGGEMRPRIDASLIDIVDRSEGVAASEPRVQDFARIIDKDGDAYGATFGPPTFGMNWLEVEPLNPFQLVEGSRAPRGPDEIVLDKGTADAIGYEVGDTAGFQTGGGAGKATVVGIATFGTADSPLGASFVFFDLETSQELLAEPGKVDRIDVAADEGVSQTQVRDQIARDLEAAGVTDIDVITGEAQTEEDQDEAAEQFGFFSTFLLVFALISVAVGAFVIYTSFSFIVAQRQRQVALLRAVGASRSQLLWSIVLESLLVGIVASMVGYGLGVGLALMLSGFIADDGISLVFQPTSIIVALATGTLITATSAFIPAWRGSRVPPVAAMRDVAIDTSHRSVPRVLLGLVAIGGGAIGLVQGLRGAGIEVAGIGMFLVFLGLVILGPVAAIPAATVLGRPLPVVRGIIGRLAQQNAARNPKRTASTASALMIGLGIVSLFLVMNASVRQSIDDVVDNRFVGDFVIDSGTGFTGVGIPGTVAEEVNELPEVAAATGVRFGAAEIKGPGDDDGSVQFIGGLDPTTGFDLFDVGIAAGDVRDLDQNGIAVFENEARDRGWSVGDELEVTFGETGTQVLTIAVLLETRDLTGTYMVANEVFDANMPDSGDSQIWIELAGGVTPDDAEPALEEAIAALPAAELQDMDEFKSATKAQLDPLLIMIIVLLWLTIVVAMVGILNTLILSIVERTREIGLTRAVGATRRQIRASIRWEALLIAAFGLIAALGVGVVFGWVIVQALADEGFSAFDVPVAQLVLVTAVTGMLTLGAALIPAIWAGRRDILAAIATE
jgi:putative ABC transport system permease protein